MPTINDQFEYIKICEKTIEDLDDQIALTKGSYNQLNSSVEVTKAFHEKINDLNSQKIYWSNVKSKIVKDLNSNPQFLAYINRLQNGFQENPENLSD